jgi:predicted thioesterase
MNVIMPTLRSHHSVTGDVERGLELYLDNKGGDIKVTKTEVDGRTVYHAAVPQADGEIRNVTIKPTRNECDLEEWRCYCTKRYKIPPLCRHVIAAILEIQGGVVESTLELNKTETLMSTVKKANTAGEVGSGTLPVFSTPSMITLMEKVSCRCIEKHLEKGQTSVGTKIEVEHIAATPIGATVCAEATIEKIFGRRIELSVLAYEGDREIGVIGRGKHTRMIVDAEKFMAKL